MDIQRQERETRNSLEREQSTGFDQIELLEVEDYLSQIPEIISRNLGKTYRLPEDRWQLRQTNGFRLYRKGKLTF